MRSDYVAALASGHSNPVKAVLATDGVVSDEAIQKFLEKCTGLHYRDADATYICDYMVQANLRAAAIALNIRGAKTGSLHNVLTQGLLMPSKLRPVPRASSSPARSSHGTRARQPTLATFEVIPAGVEMLFNITVADEKELPKERLRMLLDWGGNIGLGAKRGLGYSKYEVVALRNAPPLVMGGEAEDEAAADELITASVKKRR